MVTKQKRQSLHEFKYKRKKSNIEFIKKDATLTSKKITKRGFDAKHGQFVKPSYILGNRQYRIEVLLDAAKDQKAYFIEYKYELNAQIYLDINKVKDSTQVVTATYYDSFISFYNLSINNNVHAFINIYFDLVEIERLKLQDQIEKSDKKNKNNQSPLL